MTDFFRDAPAGAIALVVAAIALMIIEVPLRLRRKAELEHQEDGPVSEEPSRLPLLLAPLPWVLLGAGLIWYVFAE
jgi:hypothetical protein